MNKLFQSFENLFFTERSFLNLAICRILFYAYICFYHLILYQWLRLSVLPVEFFAPSGVLGFILTKPLSSDLNFSIWILSLTASVFSLVGLLGRFSFLVCFIAFSYLNSLPQQFLGTLAINTPVLFILLIFCFTEAHQFWSVDHLLKRRKSENSPKENSWRYAWPLAMVKVVHVTIFFWSGISKILNSGVDWFATDNLRNEMLCAGFMRADSVGSWVMDLGLNTQLAKFRLLLNGIAFVVLFSELISPLALFSKSLRRTVIPILFLMQIMTLFTVFVPPVTSLGFYIFWLDWEKVANRWLRARN